ncbi:MAG: radical SAM protein [Candidatus Marinimicrobia bacterium]|nr:radical SAM protein [Candidatus Neomarinimicrobiota bacterium]
MKKFKYVYGPVPSWRLGSSLGIDPLSQKIKVCTFNCIYCQLGKKVLYTDERKVYVETEKVIEEIKRVPEIEIDYITFSGMGEPTLAKNLLEIVRVIRKIRNEKIAILTNSSLINSDDVKKELSEFDLVVAKLDAVDQETFLKINRPMDGVEIRKIIEGVISFKKNYKGKLALQIMFTEENKNHAKEIAKVAAKIHPDEVQINTPLRPSKAKPLDKEELSEISKYFDGLNYMTVYETERKKVVPISEKETMERRGKIL